MTITNQQIEKILAGSQTFSNLGFCMLVMHLRMKYAGNPSPVILVECAEEVRKFLNKTTVSMDADFATIQRL
ncbi:MAG: hypothetical protein LBU89_15150 [Fibromonadaceae bacterium]|jgi:hypothetical protein|nr:hypothetical protein [Fibromonadaceae bacterium]